MDRGTATRRSEKSSHRQGVNYKFFRSTRSDRLLFQARKNYSRLAPGAPPLSTSSLLASFLCTAGGHGPAAAGVRRDSRPALFAMRADNSGVQPQGKIVLHLHAEWFSQGDPRIFDRRLKNIDLVTAVSSYVAKKTRQDFPAIANRCEVMYNGIDAREFVRAKDYRAGDGKTKRILYAGAISPHRGLHVLAGGIQDRCPAVSRCSP